MNKGFVKFIVKLLILFIVVWIIFAIIAKNFGFYIFDKEYAYYRETLDYVRNKTKSSKVLIFGDSVAKAAVIPEMISEDTYNISMAGATPIEQYYLMQDYLKNHEPPKTMIMMYFMGGYTLSDQFFWERTIYFDWITTDQFKEIIDTGLFPEKNPMLKFLQYKLSMPHKYYAAVKNALFEDRYEINTEEYKKVKETKGQHYYGTAEFYIPNNVSITNQEHFEIDDIIDLYMNKCIQLCEDNGIQVIIEKHPINMSTYANMQEGFKEEYIDYMKNLQKKYPNIIVNTDFGLVSEDWLGDFSHVNENGATQFTNMIIEKYNEYLK